MAEYFAGGHLRFLDGEWRDDNGDVVHIKQAKQGEWIPVWYDDDPQGSYWLNHCSLCNEPNVRRKSFCPGCGAEMVGKGDGNG